MPSAARIVSSESEELILVDENDVETGFLSKAECHDGPGQLHRAFSVFLFNSAGELLLQQRSVQKRLWPGYWSNTCCSHPRRGESLAIATQRRLDDELQLSTELEFAYKFAYQASYGELGSEHELCHVFLGKLQSEAIPNPNEVAAVQYLSPAALAAAMASETATFTPWFRMEWETLVAAHREQLAKYCAL